MPSLSAYFSINLISPPLHPLIVLLLCFTHFSTSAEMLLMPYAGPCLPPLSATCIILIFLH